MDKQKKTKGHVLVVDDDEMIRDITRIHLENFGCKVTLCENGQEAVDYYKDNYKDIDIVTLDVEMPVMRGGECFIELKKINPDVKVVIISGYSFDDSIKKMLIGGALAYVVKPLDFMDLIDRFKGYIT